MTRHDPQPLLETDCHPDPLRQFQAWYEPALEDGGLPHAVANAVTLATADAQGRPSARVVLLKRYGQDGFVFFTNYKSRKGQELAENPWGALLFWWPTPNRQVRVEGPVERVGAQESEAYFATRPYGSQLGAWASEQSQVIGSRTELEERLKALKDRYAPGEVPCPPHWGGYRLIPESLEFWQDRPDRLHDRIRYTRLETGWRLDRLAP